jgi:hypothetical protein
MSQEKMYGMHRLGKPLSRSLYHVRQIGLEKVCGREWCGRVVLARSRNKGECLEWRAEQVDKRKWKVRGSEHMSADYPFSVSNHWVNVGVRKVVSDWLNQHLGPVRSEEIGTSSKSRRGTERLDCVKKFNFMLDRILAACSVRKDDFFNHPIRIRSHLFARCAAVHIMKTVFGCSTIEIIKKLHLKNREAYYRCLNKAASLVLEGTSRVARLIGSITKEIREHYGMPLS